MATLLVKVHKKLSPKQDRAPLSMPYGLINDLIAE